MIIQKVAQRKKIKMNNLNDLPYKNGKVDLDYYFCLPGKTFSAEFLVAWSNTLLSLISSNKTFMFNSLYSPIVQETRNWLFNTTSKPSIGLTDDLFDGRIRPKKVIFLDDDIVWSVGDMFKILDSDYDFICGPYISGDHRSIAAGIDEQRIPISYLDTVNYPIEVSYTGLGFCAVKFEVLEKLKAPWFEVKYTKQEDGTYHMTGEDVNFCNKIRELGYSIYLDPSIQLKHMKTVPLEIPRYT